jgi:hypothetical protein
MSPEGIRKLLRQQPFKPFRLVMASGKAYEVRHPEMAFVHVASIEPFSLQDSSPAA